MGFHLDPDGDWVAELSCLHGQHVRHRPPFQIRPWTQTEAGRAAMVGRALECPLCERGELPDGLHVVRVAGPFDATTIPVALQRAHRVADRTWGRLNVSEGSLELTVDGPARSTVVLSAGEHQPIPPGVEHSVQVIGPVRFTLDFLT